MSRGGTGYSPRTTTTSLKISSSRLRGLAAARGRAGEQAAQEPARPVDADEPDEPLPRGRLPRLGGHLSQQLSAERALRLLAVSAGLVYFPGCLGPQVIPQHAPPWRGEGLELHLALAVPDRHPDAMLVGHDELNLVLRAQRYLQAAEIHPGPRRERLLGVPRAAPGSRSRRGPFRFGRLVIELVVGQFLTVLGLAGPVPADVC